MHHTNLKEMEVLASIKNRIASVIVQTTLLDIYTYIRETFISYLKKSPKGMQAY